MPIEQLCLQTGRVIQSFDSMMKASKGTGLAHTSIRYHLDVVFKGFFLRRKGSQAMPPLLLLPLLPATTTLKEQQQQTSSTISPGGEDDSPSTKRILVSVPAATTTASTVLPKKSSKKNIDLVVLLPKAKRHKQTASTVGRPVEKTCLTTKKVVARYDSISMAAKSVGVAYQSIHGIVKGYKGQVACKGYGWRYASATVEVGEVKTSTTQMDLSALIKKGHQKPYIPQSGDRFRVLFDTVRS